VLVRPLAVSPHGVLHVDLDLKEEHDASGAALSQDVAARIERAFAAGPDERPVRRAASRAELSDTVLYVQAPRSQGLART
jgi:hypothetical protein